ncbi:hypothetical protein ACFQ0B_26280 [Nonomuraea thailandensis]
MTSTVVAVSAPGAAWGLAQTVPAAVLAWGRGGDGTVQAAARRRASPAVTVLMTVMTGAS